MGKGLWAWAALGDGLVNSTPTPSSSFSTPNPTVWAGTLALWWAWELSSDHQPVETRQGAGAA